MSEIHSQRDLAYVRTQDAPAMPAPLTISGPIGWMRQNLFPTPINAVMSVIFGALLLYVIWINPGLGSLQGGVDRRKTDQPVSATVPMAPAGAMARAKFGQWMYGFYPFTERWRVDVVAIVGVLALVPMMMPSLPYKRANGIFLLGIYPVMTLILLTGGHFDIDLSTWLTIGAFVAAIVIPILLLGFVAKIIQPSHALIASAAIAGVVALLLIVMSIDFGLPFVETSKWGGPAADPGCRRDRYRGLTSDRRPAGARQAVEHAGGETVLGGLHRALARGSADHGVVHGFGRAAAVPAAWHQF